ncbi:MAG: hypothetical protein ACM31D_14760 [Bacteroidota bacterium]
MSRETTLIVGLVDPDAPRPDTAEVAELAARVLDDAMAMNTAPHATAEVAARLDGGLDAQAQDRLDRTLAADGREYQELAATADLVDAVAARLVAVPADLLGQAMARPHAAPAKSVWRWTPWLWVGGTVLATVVAAALLLHRQPVPSGGRGELMATPVQNRDTSPRMVPAGGEDVVPGKR